MGTIEFEQGAIIVDAEVIATALGIEPALVQPMIRDGKITSVCERGVGEDAGRYRLTFIYASRAYHLIVDEKGQVIERSTRDVGVRGDRPPRPEGKPIV